MIRPMRFLTQSQIHDPENGLRGTCMAACIASILGCEESDIPLRYLDPALPDGKWWDVLNEDLATLGWTLIPSAEEEPRGWHLLNGLSPRGFGHSCVGYRGELIWDPHPSRDGLVSVRDHYLLLPDVRVTPLTPNGGT